MRVIDVKTKVEAGEKLTAEEEVIAKRYGFNVVPKKAPNITNKLQVINGMLNIFKFNITADSNGFYIEDCRKTPPKRINGKAYATEDEAINRMGGRLLAEFEERSLLYKLAAAKYPDINGELAKNKKWRR